MIGPTASLAVASLGFFVVTLDALVVNVALSAIGRDLGDGITGLQWVVDGYTLPFAALLLSAGALALFLLARVARSPRRPAPIDWAGQAAAVLGIGGLTYGLIEGGALGFSAPNVVVALAVAVLAAVLCFVVEARGAHPVVPLGLFRSRPVAVSVAGGAAFSIGFYGLVFLLSLYFQQVRGLTSYETGLAFVPMTALTGVVTLVAPRIAARFGPRVPIAAGQLLQAAGLLSLCLAAVGAPIWLVAALTVLIGLGAALSVPTLTALLVASVPAERAGTASGVLNTCRQLGGALAVAVFGSLVADPATFLPGLQVSLVAAAVVLLVTAGASLRMVCYR